jgi:hypothetical protein
MVQLAELMMILELHRQGLSVAAISRLTGRDSKTIRKCIEGGVEAPAYGPLRRQAEQAGLVEVQQLPDRIRILDLGWSSPSIRSLKAASSTASIAVIAPAAAPGGGSARRPASPSAGSAIMYGAAARRLSGHRRPACHGRAPMTLATASARVDNIRRSGCRT